MKRYISFFLVLLMAASLTACGEKSPAKAAAAPQPETQAPTQAAVPPEASGPVLSVQRNLPLTQRSLDYLATLDWLDQTTESILVDDIPAIVSYRNDGGTDKPIYVVLHPTWGSKEDSLEFMPTGVSDINALFFTFDMSGYGDSTREKLEGQAALDAAVADIDKMLAYIASLGIADTDRIIIEGMEMAADLAISYREKGQFTPAIITLTNPSLTPGEYSNTQVLLNQSHEERNSAYLQFLMNGTSVKNPQVKATIREGADTVPETAESTTPEATIPETTVPETTVPESTTLPAATAAAPSGTVFKADLTVERNLPMRDGDPTGLPFTVKVEKVRVNHLAAIVAYQSDVTQLGKKPVFVYLHGSGGSMQDGYRFIDLVTGPLDGIFVSFDMPYGGESTHPMRNLTGAEVICGVVSDIDNLLAYVSTIPEADMNNIYFHGMSGGAASALAYMTKGAFTPSLLMVTVPCFDFRTYGEGGPPYARINAQGDSTPHLSDQEINAILDEHNAYLHAERMKDTYVLAGIGLAGPPNAEMDGKQMEDKFRQMGKTDMQFHYYPDVDHNIPGEFYETANDLMLAMRSGSKIVNPIVQASITEK